MDITNIEQLKNMLLNVGANEKDLDQIIKDVDEIILGKALVLYESRLNDSQKATLKSVPVENLVQHIKEHKNVMPALSKEELEKIAKETWEGYFAAMKEA